MQWMHSGCQYHTYEDYLWHGIASSTDSKWKWEVPSSCRFLSGALKQVYIHTLVSIGPTHARLTPLSDHVVVTASGKENFITHSSFCSFPTLCKWFSCVLKDKYKKVSDTTVCISRKSSEKRLLVIWCLVLTLRIWSWLWFAFLQFSTHLWPSLC